MKVLALVCIVALGPMMLLAAEPQTLPLWPDGPPSAMPVKSEATEKLINSYGGGHGIGMRRNQHPINDRPQRCAEWMQSLGLLEKK